jgi:hypothetical protein
MNLSVLPVLPVIKVLMIGPSNSGKTVTLEKGLATYRTWKTIPQQFVVGSEITLDHVRINFLDVDPIADKDLVYKDVDVVIGIFSPYSMKEMEKIEKMNSSVTKLYIDHLDQDFQDALAYIRLIFNQPPNLDSSPKEPVIPEIQLRRLTNIFFRGKL